MLGGLFDRFRKGLEKTRNGVFNHIREILSGKPRLDEETLEKIEELLIQADLGVDPTLRIIDRLRERYEEKDIDNIENAVFTLLEDEINSILTTSEPLKTDTTPTVFLIVGVNGAGKTTTIGKLAKKYTDEGKNVLIAACDTFRAAAINQIEVWANRSGAEIVKHQLGADPASVAFDALEAAKARGADVVLVDTAGRLHNKVNLMEEVKKISRVISKAIEGAPHETLLVVDATTGQNTIEQARAFHQQLTLTGLILAKLDGTAKGGIVVAVSDELDIPVRLVGLGEGEKDLQTFDPKAFTEALFS